MSEAATEAKPDTQPQAKPQPEPVAKPAEGRDRSDMQPSKPDAAPSQISKDQYEAAVKAMNKAQSERAELEQRLAEEAANRRRLEAFAQEQLGVARAATDPEQAAWRQYQEAKASYDPDAESAALQRYLEARDQKRQNALIETLTKRQRLEAQIPQAMQMLGVNDQAVLEDRLGRVVQSLTPAELALIELNRRGKLPEYLTSEQRAAEERAQQASLLKSIGQPGGRRVPGADARPQRHTSFQEWANLTPEAKERIRNADFDVVVLDAPAGFDPNKD